MHLRSSEALWLNLSLRSHIFASVSPCFQLCDHFHPFLLNSFEMCSIIPRNKVSKLRLFCLISGSSGSEVRQLEGWRSRESYVVLYHADTWVFTHGSNIWIHFDVMIVWGVYWRLQWSLRENTTALRWFRNRNHNKTKHSLSSHVSLWG